jgi:GrpB-like predicted nucleotidyltransferase (UPF0157 family)
VAEQSLRPGWDTGDWSRSPPVEIHAYDPEWPERYERARRAIADALAGLAVHIEHVGSTAVPGLGARNGIDVLIGLERPADAEACVARLQAIGYRHYFSKPDCAHLSGQGHKLPISPLRSARWQDLILFRDYLRRHPEAVSAYQHLKQELARAHGRDGRRYVEGKSAFVQSIVEQARRQRLAAGADGG